MARRRTRLGIHLGYSAVSDGGIGWCLYDTAPPLAEMKMKREKLDGDPVAAAVRKWEESGRPPVTLLRYGNDERFAVSTTAKSSPGMTWAEHESLIGRVQQALSDAGATVTVEIA